MIFLENPKNQTAEALYHLLKKGAATRRQLMERYGILNAPDVIMRLRKYGLDIETESVNWTNRYGRQVSYASYSLHPRSTEDAQKLYEKINKR